VRRWAIDLPGALADTVRLQVLVADRAAADRWWRPARNDLARGSWPFVRESDTHQAEHNAAASLAELLVALTISVLVTSAVLHARFLPVAPSRRSPMGRCRAAAARGRRCGGAISPWPGACPFCRGAGAAAPAPRCSTGSAGGHRTRRQLRRESWSMWSADRSAARAACAPLAHLRHDTLAPGAGAWKATPHAASRRHDLAAIGPHGMGPAHRHGVRE
jgi:hypothetical protein